MRLPQENRKSNLNPNKLMEIINRRAALQEFSKGHFHSVKDDSLGSNHDQLQVKVKGRKKINFENSLKLKCAHYKL